MPDWHNKDVRRANGFTKKRQKTKLTEEKTETISPEDKLPTFKKKWKETQKVQRFG